MGCPGSSDTGTLSVRVGDTIWVSGQLSHDNEGNIVGPAPVDAQGRILDHGNMAASSRSPLGFHPNVLWTPRSWPGARPAQSFMHDKADRVHPRGQGHPGGYLRQKSRAHRSLDPSAAGSIRAGRSGAINVPNDAGWPRVGRIGGARRMGFTNSTGHVGRSPPSWPCRCRR